MKIWIYSLVLALSSLAVMSQSCPSDYFSAIFTGTYNQAVDDLEELYQDDPELTFFKDYMNLRDAAIRHTIDDAMNFFNNTFGLNFSDLPPNQKNEFFLDNARMTPYILSPHVNFIFSDNLWLRTGNTRSSCYHAHAGGLQVNFLGDQILHGSYGGTEGKTVGPSDTVYYGFDIIYVCQQSPIIIQGQSPIPYHQDKVNAGIFPFHEDIYSQVLGHGLSHGVFQFYPDPEESGRFRIVLRTVYTFQSL